MSSLGRPSNFGLRSYRKMAAVLDVMSRPNETICPFCSIEPSSVVAGDKLVFAIRQTYPVTPLHTLVLPRRHVSGYFDLYLPEMMGIDELLRQLRNDIVKADNTVEGFNVGINVGTVAGQTIHHCHVHLIPRRPSDVSDPWGGVSAIIPGKAHYPGSGGPRTRN
jgi:ATP adenylyltransferase